MFIQFWFQWRHCISAQPIHLYEIPLLWLISSPLGKLEWILYNIVKLTDYEYESYIATALLCNRESSVCICKLLPLNCHADLEPRDY